MRRTSRVPRCPRAIGTVDEDDKDHVKTKPLGDDGHVAMAHICEWLDENVREVTAASTSLKIRVDYPEAVAEAIKGD